MMQNIVSASWFFYFGQMKYRIIVFLIVLLYGCREISTMPEYAAVSIRLDHRCNGLPLEFDTIKYNCAAGFNYDISRLQYYISNITFKRNDGFSFRDKGIYYVDAADPSTWEIAVDSIPPGSYQSVDLNIGIDAARNLSGYLPNTIENANMAWPDLMGGGYHMLKLEGHYVSGPVYGYAMHTGSNPALTSCSMPCQATFTYINHTGTLSMEINQWFQDPYVYNFNTDGNYTMGNDTLMQKLSVNGRDVMSFTQNR